MLRVVLPHPHRQSFKRPGMLFPGESQDVKERNLALNWRAASLALTKCSPDIVGLQPVPGSHIHEQFRVDERHDPQVEGLPHLRILAGASWGSLDLQRSGWHVAQACEAAARRGFLGPVSEQSLYHLAARTIELEVVPACRAYGVGILPWSPLGGGLLGGALGKVAAGRRATPRMQQRIEQHRPRLERWERLCTDLGQKPADVALAWLLHRPGVTAPIVGPRTMDQLEDALRAAALKLDARTLEAIEEIWPGPGGEAPEAYAW
jgi:hypothetical protein